MMVAENLSQPLEEIEDMDADQFHKWLAYFALKDPEFKEQIQIEVEKDINGYFETIQKYTTPKHLRKK